MPSALLRPARPCHFQVLNHEDDVQIVQGGGLPGLHVKLPTPRSPMGVIRAQGQSPARALLFGSYLGCRVDRPQARSGNTHLLKSTV